MLSVSRHWGQEKSRQSLSNSRLLYVSFCHRILFLSLTASVIFFCFYQLEKWRKKIIRARKAFLCTFWKTYPLKPSDEYLSGSHSYRRHSYFYGESKHLQKNSLTCFYSRWKYLVSHYLDFTETESQAKQSAGHSQFWVSHGSWPKLAGRCIQYRKSHAQYKGGSVLRIGASPASPLPFPLSTSLHPERMLAILLPKIAFLFIVTIIYSLGSV